LEYWRALTEMVRKDRGTPPPWRPDDESMVSLVVQSQTWLGLSEDILREALDLLYPGEFLPAREDANWVVDAKVADSLFMLQRSATGIFMVHSGPGPYTAFSTFAEHIDDPELRRLAISQEFWLAVDLLYAYGASDEAYGFIGRLLALLAPSDAAVLVHPSRMMTVRFTSDTRKQLASGNQPFGSA
jgi:hypothetical protein